MSKVRHWIREDSDRAFTVRRPNGAKMQPPFASKPFREDTVFYAASDNITAEEVKRSLVDHDGYPTDIIVREER